MKISDIRIKLIESTGKLKAIAAVTIDGCFVVHDIKILQGTDSLFIAMPSRKAVDGTYKDIVHPLNTETREFMKATTEVMVNTELTVTMARWKKVRRTSLAV